MLKVTERDLDRKVRQGFWVKLGKACGDMIRVRTGRGRFITVRIVPERERYKGRYYW